MDFDKVLKDLEEGKLHAFRFTWQGNEIADDNKRFVKVLCGSIDELLQFVKVLKKSCKNCMAEYLYSIDLSKSMCFYVVKEKEKSEVNNSEKN